MPKNPFKPTFGVTPPLLAGREPLIEDFKIGLDDGPGNPSRATIYTGMRGIGKTVMLNAAEETAAQRGWITIHETANKGLNERLIHEHLPRLLSEHADQSTRTKLTSLGLLGVSATWDTSNSYPVTPGLRTLLESAVEALEINEAGLLLTLDELRPNVEELGELMPILQHLFRDEREIALACAGLSDSVDELIIRPGMTFLQRAAKEPLAEVPLDEVAKAIREPVQTNGRTISEAAVRAAVDATGGYPFMIQLVGYYSWNQRRDATDITVDDVAKATLQARRRVGSLVHAPVLKECSSVSISYLLAMSLDDGPSSTSKVAERIHADANYGGQYRLRLIADGLIYQTSHGYVDFKVPGLREYLREHAAALTLNHHLSR